VADDGSGLNAVGAGYAVTKVEFTKRLARRRTG
jgi:hypothetical protein